MHLFMFCPCVLFLAGTIRKGNVPNSKVFLAPRQPRRRVPIVCHVFGFNSESVSAVALSVKNIKKFNQLPDLHVEYAHYIGVRELV